MVNFTIYGFFGGFNSGDEAILDSLILGLRQSGYKGKFSIIIPYIKNNDARNTYADKDIEVITLRNPIKIILRLIDSHLITGSGQLLDGHNTKGLLIILLLCLLNKAAGKEPVLVSAGVVNIDTSIDRLLTRWIVMAVSRVWCRDSDSREQLLESGCSINKLDVAADIVFTGTLPSESGGQDDTKRGIILAIHYSPHRQLYSLQEYVDIIRYITKIIPGRRIIILAHDNREAFDAGFAKLIYEQARIFSNNIQLSVPTNLQECLNVYSNAYLLISARLHPLILAAIHGLYLVGLQGTRKVGSLSSQLGFPLITKITFDEIDMALNLAQTREEHEKILFEISRLKYVAWTQIEWLTNHYGIR